MEDVNLFASNLKNETEIYIEKILNCYVQSFIEILRERQSTDKTPKKKDIQYLFSLMKNFVDNQIKEFSGKVNSPFSPIHEEIARANISIVSNEFPQLINQALLSLDEYILRSKLESNEKSEKIDDYKEALKIICNTMRSNDRVPIEFKEYNEDSYRKLLLHSLNGKFEGQVNAEALNKRGKTDIKISRGNETILIAECKLWGEGISKTIDQLFGYTAWHDEKLAILYFSKRVSFTNVLNKIEKGLNEREDILEVKKNNEIFKCLFQHPEDCNKTLRLSILAFNIYKSIDNLNKKDEQ